MQLNYQKVLEQTLSSLTYSGKIPRLLLHSCCGPCSSYVLEYLSQYFDITILYYNPNIYPPEEFYKRAEAQRLLLESSSFNNPIRLAVSEYAPEEFDAAAAGYETAPEGGERCEKCFRLRLEETAKLAKAGGYDYFATTLSVSPHKDAGVLNAIGGELEKIYGVRYLFADFKKKNGYQRSLELSKQYGLYRQDYCGCRYSLASRRSD